MYRLALAFVLLSGLAACGNNDEKKKETEETTTGGLGENFKDAALPYQLTDTALLRNNDTTTLQTTAATAFFPDSIKNDYFGKNAKIKFSPLAKFTSKDGTYYVVKATANSKKAAALALYDKENNFLASYPFLLPDDNSKTSQVSVLDKNFTITRNIVERDAGQLIGEGKDVVAYDASERIFSLILQDPLNEELTEIISPIDTFPKTHKLAGDYRINKKNLVSIRDGRYPNQLLVYIHTENKDGDCQGEMRGEFIMTSTTTAAYRQGGDPCVLNLTFKGNTVSISEQTGCGNYRGLDCPLTGTFTKKKPASAKAATDKAGRR
ncbi:MAG TPA: hypothetical protein VMR70_11665 [Flavisolibacter sp.]|nr:hypothetical protein [Flavisolibacter sp.]